MSEPNRKLWVVERWWPGWEPEELLARYTRAAALEVANRFRQTYLGARVRVVRYVPARKPR